MHHVSLCSASPDNSAALTGVCGDLKTFLYAQFIMWSLIAFATLFHFFTSFNACTSCHRGNTLFAFSLVVLLLGPVMLIAACAYASSTEARFANGAFATCGDAFGLYSLGVAIAWVAMAAPVLVLVVIFIAWCLNMCRPTASAAAAAEPAAAQYQAVPQSAM